MGDVVETLVCLKCMYHNDLIFCKVVVSMEDEKELEDMDLELVTDANVGCVIKDIFAK